MKKITALLLALLMVFTLVATVACNSVVLVYLEYNDGKTGTKIEVYNEDFVLPTPEREGYDFAGWFTDSAMTQEFTNGTAKSSNFHLYAKWTEHVNDDGPDTPVVKKVTLTYVYNDGATDNWQVKVDDGATAILPPNPSRTDYRFDGWWTANNGGEQVSNAYIVTSDMTLYARWTYTGNQGGNQGGDDPNTHTTHDFGDSYFMYVKCSYDGCNVYGRNQGKRDYDSMYDFTSSKQNTIENHYNECVSALNSKVAVANFIQLHNQVEQDLEYVDAQYYWATLYYDVGTLTNIDTITDLYNQLFADFCKMYQTIDSVYGNSFWNLYDATRSECLDMAAMYGDNTNQSIADGILEEYYDAMNSYSPDMTAISNLYGRLVTANNNVAKDAGYSNYMEYAYEVIYNREYTPSEVATMRNYVKQYIAPALMAVANKMDSMQQYDEWYGYYYDFSDTANEDFYYSMMNESIFEDESYEYFETVRDTVNYIGEYFNYLSRGNANMNFTGAVNDLFKNGNYFMGSGEGAYTMWIPAQEMPVVYFQQGDEYYYGYDNAFTFVHEFGHYFDNIHNGEIGISYDHAETHSQGDEMLFLAWLSQNKASNITDGFTAVELDQLFNMLSSIVMSSAVDELEQAAYTGTYNGKAVTGSYADLFTTILATYDENLGDWLSTDYWAYVVFDSAAYYISYAISGLPSVELYVTAQTKGVNAARTMYLSLFDYAKYTNAYGLTNNYTYEAVLNDCGFGNPFAASTYTNIANYINSKY